MKKNIGYINLDSSTALWLQKHLPGLLMLPYT